MDSMHKEWVQSFHALSVRALLGQHYHMFANPEALRTLSFWGFVEASVHRHDYYIIDHW